MNYHDIIIRPVLTEKSYDRMRERTYTFVVGINTNRTEVKMAIEHIFGVKVKKVNIIRHMGKLKRRGIHQGRTPELKKAIVKLLPTSKDIPFFEGMV